MRIKIIFSYDGSKFCGFQRQNNEKNVQSSVENALSNFYKCPIEIKGAGRTDAKVHAVNQVAHFDIDTKGDTDNLLPFLNNELNPDIVIKNVKKVSNEFHARKSAKKKEYIYKINLGPFQSSLNDYYYQTPYKLDISLMKDASRLLIGKHDFQNFVAGKRDNYVSTIISINFNKMFSKLEIRFVGTGFYRYMVRNLVGALIEVGKCKINENVIKEMLINPTIQKSLPTAPPEGLYLNKVWY